MIYMSKLCISIMAEELLDSMENINNNIDEVDFIEVRFDNHQLIDKIRDKVAIYKEQLICTIRTVDEGGWFNGPPKILLESYRKLIDIQPIYIDIGLETGIYEEVIEIAKNLGVGVIGSYHNTIKTPDTDILMEIYNKLASADIDVVKVVTKAVDYTDSLRILSFLANHRGEKPLIAFCMGEKGIISRIFAHLLGSHITYVSLDDEKTAPGQISLRKFVRIMEVLI